jgi:hypothetical protein
LISVYFNYFQKYFHSNPAYTNGLIKFPHPPPNLKIQSYISPTRPQALGMHPPTVLPAIITERDRSS